MQRFCSIFSQLLQLFPRLEFETAVRKHRADYCKMGFACWAQFVALLFSQLGRAHTLRAVCGGLASCEGKLKHLAIDDAPKRSTLAYANEHRLWSLSQAEEKNENFFRLVEIWDGEKEETITFLTNHRGLGASTVAAIYKGRWQVEPFFKAIKQNLKIKTFLGTSANAVKTQIWTALIAMHILRYLQLMSSLAWSLSNLVALLRHQLFVYRDLFAWLNAPFEGPPALENIDKAQLQLSFAR